MAKIIRVDMNQYTPLLSYNKDKINELNNKTVFHVFADFKVMLVDALVVCFVLVKFVTL